MYSMWGQGRERDRQTDKEKERDRGRETETDRDQNRDGDRETEEAKVFFNLYWMVTPHWTSSTTYLRIMIINKN